MKPANEVTERETKHAQCFTLFIGIKNTIKEWESGFPKGGLLKNKF